MLLLFGCLVVVVVYRILLQNHSYQNFHICLYIYDDDDDDDDENTF